MPLVLQFFISHSRGYNACLVLSTSCAFSAPPFLLYKRFSRWHWVYWSVGVGNRHTCHGASAVLIYQLGSSPWQRGGHFAKKKKDGRPLMRALGTSGKWLWNTWPLSCRQVQCCSLGLAMCNNTFYEDIKNKPNHLYQSLVDCLELYLRTNSLSLVFRRH